MENQDKTPIQQAEEKAVELSAQLNAKVHAIVFKDKETEQYIVGFIKEPNRMIKLALLDKSVMGGYSAASEVLESVLLKEHSDPRIYSERTEDDSIYLGAVAAVYDLIKLSVNQAKKKNS